MYIWIFGYKQQKLSYNSSWKGKLAVRPQRCFQAIQGIKLVGFSEWLEPRTREASCLCSCFMDFVYASCSLQTDFLCFSSYEVYSFQPHWCRECVTFIPNTRGRYSGLVWGKFSDVISWRPWMVGDWSLLPKMSVGGPVFGEGTVRGVFWAERDCKRC